jgi:hypothetical protein
MPLQKPLLVYLQDVLNTANPPGGDAQEAEEKHQTATGEVWHDGDKGQKSTTKQNPGKRRVKQGCER